jgi:hypothetical protein
MANLILNGSTSGSVTLSSPAVSGTTTLTLPATSGTVIVNSGAQTIEFADGSASAPSITNSGDTNTGMFFPAADTIAFAEGGAEAMRIDSSGNLLVGTTSSLSGSRINLVNGLDPYPLILRTSGAASGNFWFVGPNAANNFVVFNQASTGVYVLNGGTSWSAQSDERLKTDLKPIENAAEKVSTLRAVTGRYKTDEENVSRSFLIAQDVQAVLPEAVNEFNDYLGIQYTDVIPLLVAAIKEQQAIIETLKSDIAELKAKVNV